MTPLSIWTHPFCCTWLDDPNLSWAMLRSNTRLRLPARCYHPRLEIVPDLNIAAPLARAGRHAMLSPYRVSGRAEQRPQYGENK